MNIQNLNPPSDEYHATDDLMEVERGGDAAPNIPTTRTEFKIFEPLIKDVQKYADKIGECYEQAEHHRRICSVLLKRINKAAGEVKTLRQLKNNYSWFFDDSNNYPIFQGFVKVIEKIQNFVIVISQLQGVIKYYNEFRGPEFSIDRKFHSLITEFERTKEALTIGLQKEDQKIEDDNAIKLDMCDMEKYIRDIGGELFDLSKKNFPAAQQHILPMPTPRPVFQTVQDGINMHKTKYGDRKTAYDIFRKYANLGDSTAKYWVGYYLYYNCLDEQRTSEQQRIAIMRAARYFKEVTDMDLPEAQLCYGHCLWKGEGVEKNRKEAVIYFERSANNGNSTAMYNVGNMYYYGNGVIRNVEKGVHYLRQAALEGQPKAINMCKIYQITI
ncbi:11219_t:CDS:2 [Ambispora leptoticha]|uniref:11219_t:CDS:1 n=1 Tax=Ambispora leptoticha TaxID=144679 RepID=A0A9N9BIZ0_9GLOM|nr:11219_t:CDS:2 [Ambispora leptoticha]